jgi:predicted NBD/HSP70 family sugar kinase
MSNSLPAPIRRVNQANVLNAVWVAEGAVTGSDLIAATGLTRATVHAVSNDLIHKGWVRELAGKREPGNTVGRVSRHFELNDRAGYVVGMEIGEHSTTVLVTELGGRTLARDRVDTDVAALVGEQNRAVNAVVRNALDAAGARSDEVLAMGVGIAARVDRSGHPHAAEPRWQAFYQNRCAALTELIDTPVLFQNDANLAALAEQWCGAARGVSDLAVLLAGERFGAGLIESGRLLRGNRGGAGEMAHLDRVEGVGDAHGIAHHARQWGADAIAKKPHTQIRDLADGSPTAVTAEMVFTAAANHDHVAQRILDRISTRVARVIASFVSLLEPELVVISGISGSASVLIDSIRDQLPALVHNPPRLAISTLGDTVVALGAVRLALDHVKQHALQIDLRPQAAKGEK